MRLFEEALNIKSGQFDPALFPVIKDADGSTIIDFSALRDELKDSKYFQYVQLAGLLSDELDFKEGTEIIDAIVDGDGTIRIKKKKDKGKFGKFLSKVLKIGTKIAPILLGL